MSDSMRDGLIQSIDRCGSILRLVAREGTVRAAMVAQHEGIQRSTAHRYLTSMEGASMLSRHADGSYGPGPLLAHMGALALLRGRIVEEATPYMEALARECNLTVILCLWGGRGPVVAKVREEDDRFVHVSVREGAELSIDSSHGYLFAAFMEDQRSINKALAEASDPERHAVEAHRDQARELGFAEHSQSVRGIRAIAAPIFDASGSIAATIAFGGTTASVPSGHTSGVAQALKLTAAKISDRLAFKVEAS